MALESKLNCGVSYILRNCEEVLVLSDWSMAWAPEALISTWQGLTRDTLLETTALRSCEHVSMRVTFPTLLRCVCVHMCVCPVYVGSAKIRHSHQLVCLLSALVKLPPNSQPCWAPTVSLRTGFGPVLQFKG